MELMLPLLGHGHYPFVPLYWEGEEGLWAAIFDPFGDPRLEQTHQGKAEAKGGRCRLSRVLDFSDLRQKVFFFFA